MQVASPANDLGHDLRQPLLDGLRIMAEKGIGALVVMSGGRLVGIVSERDYVRKVTQLHQNLLPPRTLSRQRTATSSTGIMPGQGALPTAKL